MEKRSRYSQKREVIYNYIVNSKEHPSAEMIYEDISKKGDTSLATIYRNLKFLEETGRIKKIYSNGVSEHYDGFLNDHAHFICNKCHKILDLDDSYLSCLKDLDVKGNSITRISLTIEGICNNCKEGN